MRKLDEILREYFIEELGVSQLDNRYPRFLQIAISGIRDLNNDLRNAVKTEVLPINSNDTVDLPQDYLDYLLIGISKEGAIQSLGNNPILAPASLDSCGNILSTNAPDGASTDNSFFNYNSSHYSKDGQFVGRSYGSGGGGNSLGTYTIHKDKNYLTLNGVTGDEIVLVYNASVEQMDGSFYVHEYQVEAVKAWIAWRSIKGMRSYDLGQKRDAQAFYHLQKRQAQKRVSRFNIPEFMNAYHSGYNSAPRI